MNKLVKILLTPPMFLISLLILVLGWLYFAVLVKIYEFTWKGWE